MADTPTILVVEDEEDLRDIIIFNLNREGYKTVGVETGEQGLAQARELVPNLIILDLMLPGVNGLDVCRQVKQDPNTQNISIIIVSAKGEEADIVTGLELGADDYVAKPFSPRILLARVRAVLRRPSAEDKPDNELMNIGDLIIDVNKHLLSIAGEIVDLTKTEFKILHFLASHRGWVFTRYQIVDAVRGEQHVVTERAIDVQIAGLRKKLGTGSKLIETVRGVGYRFKE